MATKYVATTGTDGGGHTGAIGDPWRTINYGIAQLAPGDILEIRTGTYSENIASSSFANGTDWVTGSGAITVRAKSGETVTVQYSGTSGLHLDSKSYIIISDLIFDGSTDTSVSEAVSLNGCHYIRFMDNEIKNSDWGGITSSQSSGFSTYYEILRNLIHDGDRRVASGVAAHGIYMAASSGSTPGLNAHHLIEGNFIYNFNGRSNDSGIQLYGSYSSEDDRLGGITINANSISHCGYGMFLASSVTVPITVTNNKVRDNLSSGIVLFHQIDGALIYHNTIHGNGDWGIEVGANYTSLNSKIKNNAITSNSDGPIKIYNNSASSYAVITNNGFNNNGNGNAVLDQNSLSTVTGTVTTGTILTIYTNAAGNDFSLASGSPYRDAGVNVGVATDYSGNARPSNTLYDIGAFEYQVAAGVSVPVFVYHLQTQGMA